MLSIIIPYYNENSRIAGSLQKLGQFCEERFREYEIVVVDDGSTDGTWETVRGLQGLPIRSIRFAKNRGKGAAVKAGMLEAKGNYRFFTDADLPYHLSAFSSAMGMFESTGCDLVLGSRDLPGSENRARTNVVRKLASRIFSSLAGRMSESTSGIHSAGSKASGTAQRKRFSAGAPLRVLPSTWRSLRLQRISI